MTVDYPPDQWDRAVDALRDAHLLLANSGFDGAASRAVYAAFHAVTALFALEGHVFTKHSALEAAVHRDLVKAGRWSADLGRDFSFCAELRGVGDYGADDGSTPTKRPKGLPALAAFWSPSGKHSH